jgi:hypothetical protein
LLSLSLIKQRQESKLTVRDVSDPSSDFIQACSPELIAFPFTGIFYNLLHRKLIHQI